MEVFFYFNENKYSAFDLESKEDAILSEGTLFTSSGVKIYQGQWQNGLAHGKGKCFYKDGLCSYEGEWV